MLMVNTKGRNSNEQSKEDKVYTTNDSKTDLVCRFCRPCECRYLPFLSGTNLAPGRNVILSSVSVSLWVCLRVALCLLVCVYVSVCRCLCVFVCVCVYLSVSVCDCVPVCEWLCVCLVLCLCMKSFCVCVCLWKILCHGVCLYGCG